MAKDEERSVGTRDMVTNPLVKADNFIGRNGGLELLVLFGKKMAVFKELDGYVWDTAQIVGWIYVLAGKWRGISEMIVR